MAICNGKWIVGSGLTDGSGVDSIVFLIPRRSCGRRRRRRRGFFLISLCRRLMDDDDDESRWRKIKGVEDVNKRVDLQIDRGRRRSALPWQLFGSFTLVWLGESVIFLSRLVDEGGQFRLAFFRSTQ